jgi:predicted nucleotidyltransferase
MHNAYASAFVSWLLFHNPDTSNLKEIILFGSAAKNEVKKDSDIDIFIDVKSIKKKFQKEIDETLEGFYRSREALLFKTRGVDNKINIKIGKLEEWKDLKSSIEATGIVLYGPYIGGKVEGKKYVIISWNRIGKNRGAFLNKVYGFRSNGKRYQGILEKMGGRKIGKSAIMIPIEAKSDLISSIKNHDVDATIQEAYFK